MHFSAISEWPAVILRELLSHKRKLAFCFAVVTTAIVVVGVYWPVKFEAFSIIYADQQNIIQPLLKGSAEVTRLDADQVKVVRERLYARQLLEQVIDNVSFLKNLSGREKVGAIGRLRGGISVSESGRGYIKIAYRDVSSAHAYEVASELTRAFIEDTAASKREESKDAFGFIDRQVKTYKQQLQEAEERLKIFKSRNTDGTESQVNTRMASLRAAIEELNLDLQESMTRRDELKSQLSQESEILARRFKSDVYRDRLQKAQSELETLRLSYEDTYPDIVSLKLQIDDLKRAMEDSRRQPVDDSAGGAVNPVYEQLRTKLAESEVDVRTLEMRIRSTSQLLAEEQERAQRIAEFQAELSELTRDYDVTRQIYEDMLERKEKARLSMTLDIEGQGVTYKIQEPPFYPTSPSGLRFAHFYLIAPFAGVAAAIGLLVLFIQLDPRVRFASVLEDVLPEGVPMLAAIPQLTSPRERRRTRIEFVKVCLALMLVLMLYIGVAVVRLMGWV